MYNDWDKMQPFYPVIPSVYREGFSYWEDVKHLIERVHRLQHDVKNLKQTIYKKTEEIAKDTAASVAKEWFERAYWLLDNYDETIQSWFEQMTDGFQSMLNDMDNKIENINQSIDDKYERLFNMWKNTDESLNGYSQIFHNAISDLIDRFLDLENQFNQFKSDLQQMYANDLENLTNKIDEHMSLVNADRLLVTSIYSGKKITLMDALKEISNMDNLFAITVEQFNSMEITFDEFNAMEIPFERFNNLAYLIFWQRLNLDGYYKKIEELQDEIDAINNKKYQSLFYLGEWKTPYELYQEIINFLMENHGNPATYEYVNSQNIPIQQWEYQNWKADIFNWQGRYLIEHLK